MNHIQSHPFGKRDRKPYRSRLNGGFTLVEVMFASSIALTLILVLFETLSLCRNMAADIKWRLAADALAYDLAWETFNKQTVWFEKKIVTATAEWKQVPVERTSVWLPGGEAFYFRSITPDGVPPTRWIIKTNIQWPLPGNTAARLPQDYEVIRYRCDRNLFRSE